MDYISFRSFVWPQNPEQYQEQTSRTPIYQTESGITYFTGMSELKRVITGSGTFFGEDAYSQFTQLQKLMEEGTAGDLYHPLLGIRYCYFTGLEVSQESRENAVHYRFEFTQALANGEIPK